MEVFEDTRVSDFTKIITANGIRHPLVVVYENPMDYPNKYVARLWNMNKPTYCMSLAETLAQIRLMVPPFMKNVGRQPNDDPCIVEVWM